MSRALRGWWPAGGMLVLAAGLLAWNASRFVGAEARIRTKDLSFLPSPIVGQVMALGHANTVAKLRWIDSFAYFELQLERKDDTVAGTGESAFVRLYQLLVHLDGNFRPFYEHAALNLGGVQARHHETLAVLQHGLLQLPHDPQLWRLLTVELHTFFHWEERQPAAFNAVLDAWHAAMDDEQQAQQVWDWKAAYGRRQDQGLEQIPYWLTQLATAQGPSRDFILATLRDQVGRYGQSRLTSVVRRYREAQGHLPLRLEDALTTDVLRQEWPRGIPSLAPVRGPAPTWHLVADPFGRAYHLAPDGTVTSEGVAMFAFRGRIARANGQLAEKAKASGTWPSSLEEARAAGVDLPVPPAQGAWELQEHTVNVTWPPALEPTWTP